LLLKHVNIFRFLKPVPKPPTEKLPPWKVEDEITAGFGIIPPDNYRVAALCRQKFIEEETGEKFFNKVFY